MDVGQINLAQDGSCGHVVEAAGFMNCLTSRGTGIIHGEVDPPEETLLAFRRTSWHWKESVPFE